MTTEAYVLMQYSEHQDRRVLAVYEDLQDARIAKRNEYISLWKAIERENDPRLQRIWYEVERVLFIKSK